MVTDSLESEYIVALSVMDGLVGIRFAALRQAVAQVGSSTQRTDDLQGEFDAARAARDSLGSLDLAGLQAVIAEYGPVVRQGALVQTGLSAGMHHE